MHGAVLSTIALDWLSLMSFSDPTEKNETNLFFSVGSENEIRVEAVYRLFSCSAQLAAYGGAGAETFMDVLVTSADKPEMWKLFPRPEGLQILSLINPFFNLFPNPFCVLILSVQTIVHGQRSGMKPKLESGYGRLLLPNAVHSWVSPLWFQALHYWYLLTL